jgi:hypothetical protein
VSLADLPPESPDWGSARLEGRNLQTVLWQNPGEDRRRGALSRPCSPSSARSAVPVVAAARRVAAARARTYGAGWPGRSRQRQLSGLSH